MRAAAASSDGWDDRAVVAIAMLSGFTDAISYSFLISFAPMALSSHFGVSKAEEAQTVALLYSVFSMAAFCSLPAIGWLVSFNCRLAFLCSAACLVGASIAFALATDLTALLVARALQGIASAGNWTASLAMLAEHFTPQELGPVVGRVFMCSSFGSLSGPFIGGLMFDRLGKHHAPAAFAVALLAAVDLLARLLIAPTNRQTVSTSQSAGATTLGPCVLLQNLRVMSVCGCVALGALCQGYFRPVITTMLYAEGVSSTRIGYVFVGMAVGNGLGADLCGKMSQARYWRLKDGAAGKEEGAPVLSEGIINMRLVMAGGGGTALASLGIPFCHWVHRSVNTPCHSLPPHSHRY
jgi:MFS family permease